MHVAQFVARWMRLRLPLMGSFFEGSRDQIDQACSVFKDFEILEMIFDDSKDFYNQRYSRNDSVIEVSLGF